MKKALLMVLLLTMLVVSAFSASFIARTSTAGNLLDEKFWITDVQLEQALNSTVNNIQSQGGIVDEYFDSEQLPGKIGISYFLLSYLADEQIVRYFATVNDYLPQPEQIEEEANSLLEQYISNEEVIETIKSIYGSVEDFKEVIKEGLYKESVYNNVREAVITVDDQKIEEFFNANIDSLKGQYDTVTAKHILVTEEASALEIKAEIEEGKIEFTEAASEFSIDPGSAQNGGMLGAFGRNKMVPEFEEAVFTAPVGVVYGPVKSEYGYHLVLVESRDVVEDFNSFKERTEWFDSLKADYQNKVYDEWFNTYKESNDMDYEIIDPVLASYEAFYNSTSSEASLTSYSNDLEARIFVNGSLAEDTKVIELVYFVQTFNMLGKAPNDEYILAVERLFEEIPESRTVVEMMYQVNVDNPDVIISYQRGTFEDILNIVTDQAALQQYLQQYGSQFIDMIESALNMVDSEVSMVLDMDVEDSIKLKALELLLDNNNLLLQFDTSKEWLLEKFSKELDYLKIKYDITADEETAQAISDIEAQINELNQ